MAKAKKAETVTHAALVGGIAAATDLTKRQVSAVLDALVSSVGAHLKAGRKVTLKGLGSFVIRVTKARTMKSALLGGKTVKVPAKRKPTFRPSLAFRSL